LVWRCLGCGREPRPSDITKISVVQKICDPRCRWWGITLYSNGTAYIGDDAAGDGLHVRLPARTYTDVANVLATRIGFFGGPADYRLHPDPQNSTFITAWVGGNETQVVVPSTEFQMIGDRSSLQLQRFARFIGGEVAGFRRRARARTRRRLADLSALSIVEYRANGCYGTCPAYTVRFLPNDHATFISGKNHCRATISFEIVRDILRASDVTELASRYAFRTVDVFGAHLHLRYRDGFSFDSDAPDRTQWSAQFQELSDRIDQVVLDATWTPRLPLRHG